MLKNTTAYSHYLSFISNNVTVKLLSNALKYNTFLDNLRTNTVHVYLDPNLMDIVVNRT